MSQSNTSCVTADQLESLKQDLNQFFIVMCGMIVWFMAPGFALLEAGMVQARNTVNVFARNIADQLVGIIVFWLFGFAFAFGDGNSFLGVTGFALEGVSHATFAFWFLQYTYAATPASIVQGAVTERVSYLASMVQTFFLLGLTYPFVVHWCWSSQGWLAKGFAISGSNVTVQYLDYAGSGVVHATGGAAALIAAIIVGPRVERIQHGIRRLKQAPPAHNLSLMALGALILHFGFLAFNAASHYSIANSSDGDYVSHAIVNTVIAFASSALSGLLVCKIMSYCSAEGKRHEWMFSRTINASLTGMVAICASCNQTDTWSAFVIGFIAGLVYVGVAVLIPRLGIDDPLDAIAVHYGGGSWGILAAGLFSKSSGLLMLGNSFGGYTFAWQIVGWFAISVWTWLITGVVFLVMRLLKLVRVSETMETTGIDGPLHGEWAYPSEAYECSAVDSNTPSPLGIVLRRRETTGIGTVVNEVVAPPTGFSYRPLD